MAHDWLDVVRQVIDLSEDQEIDTAPAPSLQWFPEKWLGDPKVMLMSMSARGIHHHLLMLAWKGFDLEHDAHPCSLPDDPDLLRLICQRPDQWTDLWPEVERAWKPHGGRLWNLGLCRTYLQQIGYRRKRSRSGKAGARARWHSKDDSRASGSSGHSKAVSKPTEQPIAEASGRHLVNGATSQDATLATECDHQEPALAIASEGQGASMASACDSDDGPMAC